MFPSFRFLVCKPKLRVKMSGADGSGTKPEESDVELVAYEDSEFAASGKEEQEVAAASGAAAPDPVGPPPGTLLRSLMEPKPFAEADGDHIKAMLLYLVRARRVVL